MLLKLEHGRDMFFFHQAYLLNFVYVYFLVPLWENTSLYGNKNKFRLFFVFVFKHQEKDMKW